MWSRTAIRVLRGALSILVLLVLPVAYVIGQDGPAGLSTAAVAPSEGKQEGIEIAQGEYIIYKEYGGVGPIESEIFNFHEKWTMRRTSAGDYEVEGVRSFECPKDFPRDITFWLHLSPELQLIEAKEYTPLIWVPRSSPLACTFSANKVQCSANGKDPAINPDLSLAVDRPYAFSWPLSPFSMATLARQADRRLGRVTDVELVEISQPSPSNPVMPIITSGRIRFLGREQIAIAGKDWLSDKFELVAFISSLPRKSLLWVSTNGLLLKVQAQRDIGPQGMLELTRFEDRAGLPLFR
jgi:hypothetical protein